MKKKYIIPQILFERIEYEGLLSGNSRVEVIITNGASDNSDLHGDDINYGGSSENGGDGTGFVQGN